jgi:hypothetical protein
MAVVRLQSGTTSVPSSASQLVSSAVALAMGVNVAAPPSQALCSVKLTGALASSTQPLSVATALAMGRNWVASPAQVPAQ